MKTLRSFFQRLRNLFRREELDRELNDELPRIWKCTWRTTDGPACHRRRHGARRC